MNLKTVHTPAAPAAVGPYSQAVWAGDYLFCSGQIPLDPASGVMVEADIVTQTERVLGNITALLAAEGLTLANVIKTTVFLADMNQFAAMNEVYARWFGTHRPARSTVQVARLPKDALVEIEVVACR